MLTELELAAHRFAVFAEQVIQPAIYGPTAPLAASAYQCPEPIPFAQAARAAYLPVDPGWRWGPVWSTAWFRLSGRVPPEMAGQQVVLRFSSGTEALLWRDGVPHSGFDPNHDLALLFDPSQGSEQIKLYVEAACNRPLGATFFWWDAAELRQRWDSATPGALERCDLAVFHRGVWRLWRAFDFARQFLLTLAPEAPRARAVAEGLRRVTVGLDPANVRDRAGWALTELHNALRGQPSTRTRCFAVGHAHIDTAWLWRLRETERKCMRTFATALRLMEQYPDFRFLCSQAQQYAWVQERSPALFEQIAARVQEGRWEANGAMWVEPDCNVPSGESLVRQILHGTRYWERTFGAAVRQTILYLPDTFGFNAALPQIMALAGLDTFITNKLSWNELDEFPHTTFRWRGLDGTEVLGHCTPGRDYNATNTPAELLRGEKEISRKGGPANAAWLQPFGYGDGGGGPTAGMIENALLARECEGLPAVEISTAAALCVELRNERESLRKSGRDLPIWDGELYLEYHRGTLTTQAWLKRANRQAEQALRTAEWLEVGGPVTERHTGTQARTDGGKSAAELDATWKLVLLNQFHDILPGSSIGVVYDDARQQHVQARETCAALIENGMARWAAAADTRGMKQPMVVFNPCSAERSGVVELAGELHFVSNAPALGMAVRDRATAVPVMPVVVAGQTLSNGLISATIDPNGCIASLRRVGAEREYGARRPDGSAEPLNQLVLYDDRPRFWEAWDVDLEYAEKLAPVNGPAEVWRVAESGPLRATIEVARPLGSASRITQRFVLTAGSPRLDIQTHVDWHEERKLLRALFPVDVRSTRATYEVQFGHVERPTHRNTSWDRARFEVCAHRWMDLSEPGFGVALLNDCKYGHSCQDDVLGLSLLRSPKFPDAQADQGEHDFTYSLMPHGGDWRAAGVAQEAEALNTPLVALPLPMNQAGAVCGDWSPFILETEGAAGVQIVAVKPAEADDRLILRLVETHGGRGRVNIRWNLPVVSVAPVDLLERPFQLAGYQHDFDARRTTVELQPFQIATLAARR